MSFIAKIFTPKAPPPPVIKLPEPAEVPNYDDGADAEERKMEAAKELKETMRKRRGRSSTILTSRSGLNEIEEDEINKKTLLG
tara:strand:- start:197 stop:445 length:249 start_codon:yes stop_codon:yes gene_type:complete